MYNMHWAVQQIDRTLHVQYVLSSSGKLTETLRVQSSKIDKHYMYNMVCTKQLRKIVTSQKLGWQFTAFHFSQISFE